MYGYIKNCVPIEKVCFTVSQCNINITLFKHSYILRVSQILFSEFGHLWLKVNRRGV